MSINWCKSDETQANPINMGSTARFSRGSGTTLKPATPSGCRRYPIYEDKAQLEAFVFVPNTLSQDEERYLWELMKVKAKKQEIVDRFHISLDRVCYREKRFNGIIDLPHTATTNGTMNLSAF